MNKVENLHRFGKFCIFKRILQVCKHKMELSENWSKRETLTLIEIYKKYPELYATLHCDYNNRSKKQDAFEKITEEMQTARPGVTCKQIKQKIRGLNRQLSVERQRLLDAVAQGKSADSFEWTLWCFKELTFILKANENCLGQKLSETNQVKDPWKMTSQQPETLNLENYAQRATLQLKRGREASSMEILHKCAKTSVDLMTSLLEKSQKKKTKQELFCSLLCEELRDIQHVETYDIITSEILNVVRQAKAKERKLLEKSQFLKEISSYNLKDWDESISSAEEFIIGNAT